MRKHLLLLEDDSVNQELLKLYLNDIYDTRVVSTMQAAMNEVRMNTFDLIVSDIFLGDTAHEGIEFLKFLRSNEPTAKIPVIAFSAFDRPQKLDDFEFTTYLQKPVTKGDFLKVIKELIGS